MTANTPSKNDTNTHQAKLLAHLMTGQTITALQALDLYQCFSCSQRLGDLRRAGVPVQSRTITTQTGKRV